MSKEYYQQWSDLKESDHEEPEDDTNLSHDEDDTNSDQDQGCCASGCMDCLGMSWKDFF